MKITPLSRPMIDGKTLVLSVFVALQFVAAQLGILGGYGISPVLAQSDADTDRASEPQPEPMVPASASEVRSGQPLPSLEGLPPLLKDWLPWVNQLSPELACPRVGDSRVCIWPGLARYELSESGAKFSLFVRSFGEEWFELPSTIDVPLHAIEVLSDLGKPISVAARSGSNGLEVKLPAGNFQIRGQYSWSEVPGSIPAPGLYGLVSADSVGGADGKNGRLKIEREGEGFRVIREDSSSVSDALSLRVLRKLEDSSPASLTTRLVFRVSGAPRSINIGRVLPESVTPISVESNLPIQLKRDGSIAVQLVAGEHVITVRAVVPQPLNSLLLPTPDLAYWPDEETLVWVPNNLVRAAEVRGASPLSSELSSLPADWTNGATYLVEKGGTISFEQLSRGEVRAPASSLKLARRLWLDLDGQGFTVRDRFSGTLSSTPRLNTLPETKLGRALIGSQPVLIAPDPAGGSIGVEIRNTAVDLEADSRLVRAEKLSAVGWGQLVDSLTLKLALPPSWKLLWVSGAQAASGSWWDSWTLLDVFMVMLMAVGVYKLFGRLAAFLAVSVLVCSHGEFLEPRMLLVHLLLLTLWRLAFQKPEGVWYRLCTILLATTFSAWALQSLAFMKLQMTQFLYPQLQAGTRYRTLLQELLLGLEGSFAVWPCALLTVGFIYIAFRSIVAAESWFRRSVRIVVYGLGFLVFVLPAVTVFVGGSMRYFGGSYSGSGYDATDYEEVPSSPAQAVYNDYRGATEEPAVYNDSMIGGSSAGYAGITRMRKMAPKPVEQASNQAFSFKDKVFLSGPAVPQWRWRAHSIEIDGPVGPDHQISFVLLSPIFTRMLSLLRIAALWCLLVIMFRSLGFRLPKQVGTATAALVLVIGSICFGSQPAAADVPSAAMLEELHRRVLDRRCQSTNCATILEGELKLDSTTFELNLKIASHGPAAVTVPGPLAALVATEVAVNAKTTTALRRNAQNFLQVQVDDGLSTVTVKGLLTEATAFTLQFPDRPQYFVVSTTLWFVEGISPRGSVSDTVRLTSRSGAQKDSAKGDKLGSSKDGIELPNWFSVHREVLIADQISVTTEVRRLGESGRNTIASIPMLENERLTSEGVRADSGKAVITIPAGSETVSFSSAIPYTSDLVLKAVATQHVSEQWSVSCHSIVHCSFEGLTPAETIKDGVATGHWFPFPGEEARVKIQSLSGISGDLLTVDSVAHSLTWGTNVVEGRLDLAVRVTQQQNFVTTLPETAEVRSVSVVPPAAGSAATSGSVPLLLNPGNHQITISYTLGKEVSVKELTPKVSFSHPVHNISISVNPGSNRWLLWTGGVAWGPAIVFWSKLLILVCLTVAASSRGLLPCQLFGAVFLGLGLATLPLIALGFPLTWLVGIKLWPAIKRLSSRLPQWVVLAAISLAALSAIASFYRIVQIGLVLQPPMLVAGNQSQASNLRWFLDHAGSVLPEPWVLSLPIYCWRTLAICWSVWLVLAICSWLKLTVEIVRDVLNSDSKTSEAKVGE